MIYSAVDQEGRASCVGCILADSKWKAKITEYSFVIERMVTVRFQVQREYIAVIGVYALEEGKRKFRNIL
jgi:hypothetical protein